MVDASILFKNLQVCGGLSTFWNIILMISIFVVNHFPISSIALNVKILCILKWFSFYSLPIYFHVGVKQYEP